MTSRTSDAATDIVEIIATPEIARQLDAAEAEGKRAVLVHQGVRYELSAPKPVLKIAEDKDIWKDYDPKKVHEALDATAGTWSDIDADKLIADIYRWREEGTRPPNRP